MVRRALYQTGSFDETSVKCLEELTLYTIAKEDDLKEKQAQHL